MIGEKNIRKEVRKKLNTHRVVDVFEQTVKCSCDNVWRRHMDHVTHVSQAVGDLTVKLVNDALRTKRPSIRE